MSTTKNLTIVVQGGGESRRMGRPKPAVPFLGEPLIMRSVNRLLPMADEFIITTNMPEILGFLDEHVSSGQIRLVPDLSNTRGALHGIHTALNAATKEYVAMVACDMVFPSRHLIGAELDALITSGADVAVPLTKYGYEPFHGVYRRETCLSAVVNALDQGEVRAASWFDRVNTIDFTQEMIDEAEPRGGCFANVNTPDELHAMEQRILNGEIRERASFGA